MTAGHSLTRGLALARRAAHGALLVAIALCALAACSREQPVSDADKAIFLRAGDLEQFNVRYEDVEASETFTKTRHFDGTHEVSYQFLTPESESERPLYIYISVSVERRAADALIAQKAGKLGLSIGFGTEGTEEREMPVKLPYGDDARLALLVRDGRPIGNTFSMRDGSKTYLLIMSGLYFSDAEMFKSVIAPKLERFATYAP